MQYSYLYFNFFNKKGSWHHFLFVFVTASLFLSFVFLLLFFPDCGPHTKSFTLVSTGKILCCMEYSVFFICRFTRSLLKQEIITYCSIKILFMWSYQFSTCIFILDVLLKYYSKYSRHFCYLI